MRIRIILCLCLAVCLTVLGVAGYMMWNKYIYGQKEQNKSEPTQQNMSADPIAAETSPATEEETVDAAAIADAEERAFVQLDVKTYQYTAHDFVMLKSINGDCTAWLTIPGTTIDYPVMHTPRDPEKYRNKNFEGNYSISGVPFLDAGCSLYSDNMIVHGRDMNTGKMFAPLIHYETEKYVQEHPTILFETESGEKSYTVYAAARVKSDDLFFDLKDAPSKAFFEQKITSISQRALYTIGDQPKCGQRLLTLSACADEGCDDCFIVIAVQK